MITVRIRNYQSIEAADLEVSGLTVLTGSNNSGKSAIFRAIHGVFTNTRGNLFVRNGKEYCSVTLDFHDGQTVTWEKGSGVNRYRINGKWLNKVSQKVPDEVANLGVVPVNLSGRDPLWPQFAHQFNGQVFLLDSPGSVLAEAIADVDRVGVLNEALRQSQSDHRSSTMELKVRQSDVDRLEVQESKFQGLDELDSSLTTLVFLESEVSKYKAQLAEVNTLKDRRDSALRVCSILSPIRAIPIPSSDPRLSKLQAAYEWSLDMKGRLIAAREQVALWKEKSQMLSTSVLPSAPNFSSLMSDFSQVNQIKEALLSARGSTVALLRELERAKSDLDAANTEFSKSLGRVETCPTCGSISTKQHDHSDT